MNPSVSFEKQNFQEHTETGLEEELKNIKETAIRYGNLVYNDSKFTYALTPNKKVSSLPENLWLYVRTKAFREWFGDWEKNPQEASKIIDKNGEPLIVYHGGKKDLNLLDTERTNIKPTSGLDTIKEVKYIGSYFTQHKYIADGFRYQTEQSLAESTSEKIKILFTGKGNRGQTYKAFLNLRNPYTINSRFQSINNNHLKINPGSISEDERRMLLALEYDGVLTKEEIVAFSNSQIYLLEND